MLRVTFPALRQDVHTLRRLGAPLTRARTRWMLGFHRRLVRTWGVRDALAEDGALAANVAHSSHGLTPDLQCFNAQADAWRQVLPPRRRALGNPNTIADPMTASQAAEAWVRAHIGVSR